MKVKIHKLPNGLTLALDYIEGVETATLGYQSKIGSRFEDENNQGISHFIEHMAFKSSKKRSTLEIAQTIEGVGAYVNAWTSKEATTWFCKILKEHIATGIDVLSDILINYSFLEQDLEKERNVIFQEINSYEDDPDDVVYEQFFKLAYGNQNLGRPIIGTKEVLANLTRQDLINYAQKNYVPENTVFCISGNFDEQEVIKLVEEATKDWKRKGESSKTSANIYEGGSALKYKDDLSHAYLMLGYPSFAREDENHYNASIFTGILGSGMSSRLFQNVRENKGLAYSIYAFNSAFDSEGIFAVYSSFEAKTINEVITSVDKELKTIVAENATEEELSRVKNSIKTSLASVLETTSSRFRKVCQDVLKQGKVEDVSLIIDKVNNVNLQDVKAVASKIIEGKKTTSVVASKEIDKYFKI